MRCDRNCRPLELTLAGPSATDIVKTLSETDQHSVREWDETSFVAEAERNN